MPVGLFTIVLALTLAACEKKEVASRGPPGPTGPPGPAGPPGGTVNRFVDGECRQTCTLACEANERILNTFAMGPGGTFIFEEENRPDLSNLPAISHIRRASTAVRGCKTVPTTADCSSPIRYPANRPWLAGIECISIN